MRRGRVRVSEAQQTRVNGHCQIGRESEERPVTQMLLTYLAVDFLAQELEQPVRGR